MYKSINGIGLLVVRDLAQVPSNKDGRGLVLLVDEDNVPEKLYYYDILGRVELDPDGLDMPELERLAQEKEVNLSSSNPKLLYLSSQEINATLDVQADAVRDERQIAPEYLRRHPDKDKLSRKLSGLQNSYLRDGEHGIIALESKDECRVVWQDNLPSVNVFKNLPANTSAAYVVVRDANTSKYDIYYVENKQDATPLHVKRLTDPRAFTQFYLNNAGVSVSSFETIANDTRHVHTSRATNVLGAGAFGRVKKSRIMHDDANKVTKTQVLPKEKAIKSKLDNRDARISSAQQEARTSADVHGGSDKVAVIGDKAYMHMHPLGEPLSKVIPELDRESKIDVAIKFLSAVAALHRGDTKSRTRYAHRDIKPPNVLYNRETGAVNLVDFGFSTSNVVDKSEMNAGTLFYSALDQSVINDHLRLVNPNGHESQSESSPAASSVYDSQVDQNFWKDSEGSDSDNDESVHNFSTSSDSDSDGSVHDISDDSGFGGVQNTESDKSSDDSGVFIPAGQNLAWQNKLADRQLCPTENYLEDDKVASLRTVFCNPEPVKPGSITSIFTAEEFASFPEPIRAVFDSATIAPLLTAERRGETLDFFAAVMISYQANPNLSDREYNQLIRELRQDHVKQARIQEQYKYQNASEDLSLDENDSTDMEDFFRSDDVPYSPDYTGGETDSENDKDSPVVFKRKIKPVAEDDLNETVAGKYKVKGDDESKKSFFRGITNYFKKRKATVSPTTTDELSDADEETVDRSTTPKN